jgi:hypothetical protein
MGIALLLGGILAIGLVLRLVQIRESLWLDELHTAWTLSDGLARIAPRAMMGNQSPLYFYLPWASSRSLGMSELAVRLPSAIAGTALVAIVYGSVLVWVRCQSMALMAAALAAIDRNFLFYSMEARPYVLVQMAGVLQVLVFWQLVHRPSATWRLIWAIGTAILFYLHYTAVLLIAAEIGWYAIVAMGVGKRPAYRPCEFALDLGLSVVFCLPASGHLIEIASRRENWAHFVPRQPLGAMLSMFPLGTYVLLPLAVVVALALIQRSGPQFATANFRLLALGIAWLLVPLGVAWVTTHTELARLFFRRYVMVSSVAPLLIAAWIGSLCPTPSARLVLAALVVAVSLVTVGPLPQLQRDGRVVRHSEEDWRGAVRAVNTNAQYAHLPVFVRSGLIEADARLDADKHHGPEAPEYCLLPIRGIYRLDDPDRVAISLPTSDSGRLTADQWNRVARQGGAWLLLRGREGEVDRIVAELDDWSEKNDVSIQLEERLPFGRVTLVRLLAEPR